MSFIKNIIERAKSDKKTIVLPETMDRRVLEAADKVLKDEIANIILIGDPSTFEDNGLDLSKAKIINPNVDKDLTEDLINKLYELRKEKGLTLDEARNLIMNDYMYYACMLVKEGMADGVVSGACHSTANTLRPALQIVKTKKDCALVSAFFLMVVPNCDYGAEGTFVFADSGLVQDPSASKLAYIAKDSADSFEKLVEKDAYVAMISHSTKGSASHVLVDKVIKATNIAKRRYPKLRLDGELQIDAALDKEVAKSKAPESSVAGKANVLIFPNLDSGNSGYKLVQRLAKAEAYGPITQGIARPINDLSRGCSSDDIVGVVAITAVQAQ